MEEFDYIIVGAGSAGCVLAERLSRDPRVRVLLLEAGGGDRRLAIRTPIGYGATFNDARVNWRYHAEPCEGLGGRAAYWPRGKVVGGSSAINAMVYCRGMPADFDDWRDAGNPGWGWADVAPVFRRIERRVRACGTAEGDGPLWVSDREAEYHPIRRHFYAAAEEIGLKRAADLNGDDPEGVGAYPITTRRGWRCSAADAFLKPALRRPNLALRTGCRVSRVLFAGRRAMGVAYARAGRDHRVRARREVLLAAGAVASPQLLQLSGVGPGALLQDMGIGVVHAAEAVGAGLQDHLGINYLYRATEPTLNAVFGLWRGRVAAALRFAATRAGPLSLSVNQMGGMVRSGPGRPRPDIQLYFNPLSYSTEKAGTRTLLKPDPWPGFIMGFNACRPTSRGRIAIASPDPAAQPRITPAYLSSNADLEAALAGARLIGRLQETRAMRGLIDGAPVFDPAAASDEAVLADFRARAGTVFHPCSTCRMGPKDAGGALDPSLRLRGVEGLRVVDASAFPNITSANTNAPVIMLAAHAAEMIAAA